MQPPPETAPPCATRPAHRTGDTGPLRRTRRVAVATCAEVPGLDQDGPELLAALHRAGAAPQVVVWDDPAVDWGGFDAVLVRSTWDYPRRREEFLTWAKRCSVTVNPAPVLAWNTDKRYLLDLQDAGVPVAPTVFLEPGEPYRVPQQWRGDVVVKPTSSNSAADTGRYRPGDPGAALLVAALHQQGRTAMVQPYLTGIDHDGETALVHLAGQVTHTLRKAPLLTGPGTRTPLTGDAARAQMRPAQATSAQLELAQAALAAVPGGAGPLAYARIDLVPGPEGPLVLELELTEPSLFLDHAPPGAVDAFAAAVVTATR